MKLLAIDTSTTACSVALEDDGTMTERHEVRPRAHTGILVPMINELLENAGLEVRDLDAVILGNGPGSFIGMRIGASVAQGVCHGAGLPIVPVSSLAAVAAEVMQGDAECTAVVVAQDARMGEVYVGEYERDDAGLPVLSGRERILPVGAIDTSASSYAAAGDAWNSIATLASANATQVRSVSPVRYPQARHLLALGAIELAAGRDLAPQDLTPTYLRTEVAKVPGTGR